MIIKILILFFCLIFFDISFPQDTSKAKIDTLKPILSENKYQYINPSNPDTVTRNTFLWYPLKNIEDVFNYIPGYYLKYMDVGQVQNLSYEQLDYYNIGVFRHGRPLNDLLDGSIDFNLLSRNEIAEIELTKEFGNFLYNYNNGINIIDRQIYQYRPFSEISFWQDRFQNLYFDGSYHQNIGTRGRDPLLNFNFGITKHSYDGKYTNSDFDKWLGRFNLNYIGSKKFNSFLNVNYSRIQRGLNEGVNTNYLTKDTLFNETVLVRNSDSYEIRERFDIDFGLLLVPGKDFSTKLQFFTSNSFRKYRDEENRPNPNGIFVKDNSHWIDYGIKLQQTFKLNFAKNIDFISRTEAEYNKDLVHTNLNTLNESERVFFIENLDLAVKNLKVSAYGKTYKLKYIEDKFYTDFGAKGEFKFINNPAFMPAVYISYSNSHHLPNYQQFFLGNYLANHKITSVSTGLIFQTKYGILRGEYYNKKNKSASYEKQRSGLNAYLSTRISKLDLEINYHHILTFTNPVEVSFYPNDINPENSGNIILSFQDIAFKSKFEYKVGFTSRFWSDYWATFYNGFYNSFDPQLTSDRINFKIPANASLDFFFIGKISRAIFGLTFENILNRLYYTTGIYPNQNRGGLGNIISRFNITWSFLN